MTPKNKEKSLKKLTDEFFDTVKKEPVLTEVAYHVMKKVKK